MQQAIEPVISRLYARHATTEPRRPPEGHECPAEMTGIAKYLRSVPVLVLAPVWDRSPGQTMLVADWAELRRTYSLTLAFPGADIDPIFPAIN